MYMLFRRISTYVTTHAVSDSTLAADNKMNRCVTKCTLYASSRAGELGLCADILASAAPLTAYPCTALPFPWCRNNALHTGPCNLALLMPDRKLSVITSTD